MLFHQCTDAPYSSSYTYCTSRRTNRRSLGTFPSAVLFRKCKACIPHCVQSTKKQDNQSDTQHLFVYHSYMLPLLQCSRHQNCKRELWTLKPLCTISRPTDIVTCIYIYTVISGSLSPRHGASAGYGWRNGLQMCRVAANILNKQSRIADNGWSSSLRVGRGVKNTSL